MKCYCLHIREPDEVGTEGIEHVSSMSLLPRETLGTDFLRLGGFPWSELKSWMGSRIFLSAEECVNNHTITVVLFMQSAKFNSLVYKETCWASVPWWSYPTLLQQIDYAAYSCKFDIPATKKFLHAAINVMTLRYRDAIWQPGGKNLSYNSAQNNAKHFRDSLNNSRILKILKVDLFSGF